MSDSTPTPPLESRASGRAPEPLRRKIIFWIPAAILASVVGSIVTTAFKFLRPRAGEVGVGGGAGGDWLPVAKIGDIKGDGPLRREVFVEHRAGWSAGVRGHSIFVLPGKERRVVSAVCPHEGCEVEWSADQRQFLCPCHDSAFNPDGLRLSGPAQSDLARLPARVNGDTLEMQFVDTATPSTSAETPTN
ncbi:MAG: ubiquinol-cytochrome c reductase iron-sulfur subunit [Rubrivivax sp.]|nr:ubiquinol-cytochrome c reductase iron-sulfur subunit [Pyrinomonadaceae bacterium]